MDDFSEFSVHFCYTSQRCPGLPMCSVSEQLLREHRRGKRLNNSSLADKETWNHGSSIQGLSLLLPPDTPDSPNTPNPQLCPLPLANGSHWFEWTSHNLPRTRHLSFKEGLLPPFYSSSFPLPSLACMFPQTLTMVHQKWDAPHHGVHTHPAISFPVQSRGPEDRFYYRTAHLIIHTVISSVSCLLYFPLF